MVDWLMDVAANPATPGWVLGIAGALAVIEAARTSRETLWGEFFADDLDE